jgi:uncharacterized membrane protein YqjE
MMERIERLGSLGGEYASTVAALARTEVRQDLERMKRSALALAIGVALALAGVLWLNITVLLLLLRTPYPEVGAGLIGAIGLIAGLVALARARRNAEQLRLLEATRRVIADEFGAEQPTQATVPTPEVQVPQPPMMPAEASARLREIREEMREAVSLKSSQPVVMLTADGHRFEPRSKTMRSLLWVWNTLPRVPSGTAVAGTVGVLAVSSPTLRRLVALAALARSLGGSLRKAA